MVEWVECARTIRDQLRQQAPPFRYTHSTRAKIRPVGSKPLKQLSCAKAACLRAVGSGRWPARGRTHR